MILGVSAAGGSVNPPAQTTVTGEVQTFKIRQQEIQERGVQGVAQTNTARPNLIRFRSSCLCQEMSSSWAEFHGLGRSAKEQPSTKIAMQMQSRGCRTYRCDSSHESR